MTLCPSARHFTVLALCPCTYCKSLWLRASAKWLNVMNEVWMKRWRRRIDIKIKKVWMVMRWRGLWQRMVNGSITWSFNVRWLFFVVVFASESWMSCEIPFVCLQALSSTSSINTTGFCSRVPLSIAPFQSHFLFTRLVEHCPRA